MLSEFACYPEKTHAVDLENAFITWSCDSREGPVQIHKGTIPKDIAVIHVLGGDILVKVSRYTNHALEGHPGMPS